MEKIGFIGLGVMGIRMSVRLLDAGYDVCAFDLSEKALRSAEKNGCKRADTIEEVVKYSQVIISMLPTPAITRDVLIGANGVLEFVTPGMIIIDMSTSSPTIAKEMAREFIKKDVHALDAPVSGGKAGAKDGSLAIMVGGDKDTFEKVKTILTKLGKNIFYIGNSGSGHTIKLVNNMLFSIIMAATSEAMVLGTEAGLDPNVLREVMLSSSGRSYALESKIGNFVLPRKFEAGFSVALQTKDIDLALQLGKDLGTPLILGNFVRQLYQTLICSGKSEYDTSIIYELFEKLMKKSI